MWTGDQETKAIRYRQKQIAEGLKSLLVDQQGSTAIEYGLIASLVALTSMEAMEALASALADSFTQTSNAMSEANASGGDPEEPYEPPVAAGDVAPPEPPIAAMRIG
ncbi:MAG: Flp family type IVb pilin [Sphingomonadaceae bacterium]|nr:Flp family type IVb pilin [Sphingomonadaceae bacterium]